MSFPYQQNLSAADSINVLTPRPLQVVQRDGATGDIAITGTANLTGTHTIEASWNGGAYQDIDASVSTGLFGGTLSAQTAGGRGTLIVRVKDETTISFTVASVGIGEVFAIAGQSNAVGQGTNNQSYSHATKTSTLFGLDYQLIELADPTHSGANKVDSQPASVQSKGSSWPLLVTSVMSSQDMPVMIIPCASAGADIAQWLPGSNHQDRSTLYGAMVYRCLLAGGVRAVLWHQGETDAATNQTQTYYNGHLDTIANAIATDLGCGLMACKLQDTDYNETNVNAAIAEAWSDNANVLQGPDFSDIVPSVDGLHFITDGELTTAASRWWTAIETAFGWGA